MARNRRQRALAPQTPMPAPKSGGLFSEGWHFFILIGAIYAGVIGLNHMQGNKIDLPEIPGGDLVKPLTDSVGGALDNFK